MGGDSRKDAGGGDGHEGIVRHQDQVWLADDAALVNRLAGGPNIGKNGGAPAFCTIAGGILDLKTLQEEGEWRRSP